MRKTTLLTIVGFLMAGLGILSLILMLFGAKFSFLNWLDFKGPMLGFILKLLMSMGGFILIFLARVDWKQELKELDNDQ